MKREYDKFNVQWHNHNYCTVQNLSHLFVAHFNSINVVNSQKNWKAIYENMLILLQPPYPIFCLEKDKQVPVVNFWQSFLPKRLLLQLKSEVIIFCLRRERKLKLQIEPPITSLTIKVIREQQREKKATVNVFF